jgi:hypothetical protein
MLEGTTRTVRRLHRSCLYDVELVHAVLNEACRQHSDAELVRVSTLCGTEEHVSVGLRPDIWPGRCPATKRTGLGTVHCCGYRDHEKTDGKGHYATVPPEDGSSRTIWHTWGED